MPPLPSAIEVTEVDRQTARTYEHLRAPEVYAASFRFVEPYFHGKRALDLGCGTGVYLKRLAAGSVGIDYFLQNFQELDFDTWMRLDMEYIDNWSLRLDLRILLKPIHVVVSAKGPR